ncbi:PIN domain-containing protein [uncultured Thiodictyon sp.]|uniref:PIN domain-containing protein n=1 Tax=uncultured Thiodictyon sp. TaxID=1846217 RepID=UPI0025ED20A4|nr:PIN domain-containing protein [uncultured Thiodictyon sp.]
MIKTYVDANALIAAFRGDHPASAEALGVLGEPGRAFVACAFLRLETLRKPLFYRREDEIVFMERYFAAVSLWVPTTDALVQQALGLAAQRDLGAMDALHAAAALQAGADVFVTLERPTKPLFQVPGLNTISLHPERTA